MNLGENVRLVHGRDTCDESGRPLSKYVCDYHQGYRDALDEWTDGARSTVTVGKNERGAWCVFMDGEFVSDHRSRDGAATAANNLIRAEAKDGKRHG